MKVILLFLISGFIGQSYGKSKPDTKLLERILDALDLGSSDDGDDIVDDGSHDAPSRRVLGSYKLQNGQRPWLALLKAELPTRTFLGITLSSKHFYCGASIYNSRWLITAAHCFDGEAHQTDIWEARIGDVDKESGIIETGTGWLGGLLDKDEWKVWEIDVEKIIKHPNYQHFDGDWRYDIALVKLEEAVPTRDTHIPEIQAVELPQHGESAWPEDGTDCYLAGWGCIKSGGDVMDEVREVRLQIINRNLCKYQWDRDMSYRICAGPENPNYIKGMCKGDSGGPLMCLRNGKLVQAGIASFTSYDKRNEYPEIYTRISDYVDWIRGEIRDN